MKKNGFSLIELLMAMVIISICVLSVSMMFQEALRGSPPVKGLTVATALAEKIMENSTAMGFNVTAYSRSASGYNYTVSIWNVSASDLDTQLSQKSEYKHIRVTVAYPSSPGSTKNITLDSVVTDHLD